MGVLGNGFCIYDLVKSCHSPLRPRVARCIPWGGRAGASGNIGWLSDPGSKSLPSTSGLLRGSFAADLTASRTLSCCLYLHSE